MDLKLEDSGASIYYGDLAIDEGDLVSVTDMEATRQRLWITLRTFLGEWYLDITEGVPYYENVLVKNPNPADLDAVFKDAILSDPKVESLESFTLTIDSQNRQLTLSFRALCEDGEVIELSEELIP